MRNLKWFLATTFFMVVLLVVLATSTIDYSVSKQLINHESGFAEFFNRFGEVPAMLGLLIGTAILFGGRSRKRKWLSAIGTLVSLPFMALFSLGAVYQPFRYAYEFAEGGIPSYMMPVIYGLAAILFAMVLIIANRIGEEKLRAYKGSGLVLLVLVILEMVTVNVLKIVWARPRMRSMESFEQFKYWFEIGGPASGEEFKSFPSGHTANAFVMLAYTMFIPQDKKKLFTVATVFALTWGICVALSRVILGAHFLSDVFVGGYIAVVLFYGLNGWLNRPRAIKSTTGKIKNYGKKAI